MVKSVDNICDLPPEVLVQILSEVPLKDLLLAGSVCWKFRDIVQYVHYHNRSLIKSANKLENWWLKYRGKVRDNSTDAMSELWHRDGSEYGHEKGINYIDSNGVWKGCKPYHFPEFNYKLWPRDDHEFYISRCGDIVKFIRIRSTNTPITKVKIVVGHYSSIIYERKTNNKELFIPMFKEGFPIVSVVYHAVTIKIEPQIPQEELIVIARYILLPNELRNHIARTSSHFENVIITSGMVGIVPNHS